MKTNVAAPSDKRHHYPAEIIAHTVWLHFRFSLSFGDVDELMAARGVILSYETVRHWTLSFGQHYANDLRRNRPQPGDKWLCPLLAPSVHGIAPSGRHNQGLTRVRLAVRRVG